MAQPLISIIVPIYKVEKELDRCVQSLLNQTYSNIEIILVDDGSPDNCPQMCDDYAVSDRRIRVIHKENGGLSDARNAGLKAAGGEYVMYVDSDDYIDLFSCEELLRFFSVDVDFVIGAYREVREDEITIQRHSNLIPGRIYSSKELMIASVKANEFFAPSWMNMYRRDFLVENNLYFKTGIIYEDMQILPRLFLAAQNVVYSDLVFYNYIIRSGSITGSDNGLLKTKMTLDVYRDWIELLSTIDDVETKRYLCGVLVHYYLASARFRKIKGWQVSGMDFGFAMKYALNARERMKAIVFTLIPGVYIQF